MDERQSHRKNVKYLKSKNLTARASIFDGIRNAFRPSLPAPKVTTTLKPKQVELHRLKDSMAAYRGSIANLFTSNDPTLTTRGWVRLFYDTGYYGDVAKCLTIYQRDDLVAGLVDSLVNAANTKLNLDLPSNNQNEFEVWEQWARMVNIDTIGILPGITMLNEQIMKSMMLTGMAVVDFAWSELKVGKRVFEFPTKITIYPSLSVKLQASTTDFGGEEVLINVSDTYYKNTLENAVDDVAVERLFTDVDDKGRKAMARKNAYAIKYKYSPNNQTLYPNPMINRSMESIALRHKMIDADISTLELIINKIIQIKVGDKDNPPTSAQYDESGNKISEGDIEEAQSLFEALTDEVEVIATPYNYNIEVVTPDTVVLLNQSKYVQSTFNIYANFGILLDPSSNSNSAQFEQLNLKNYEKNAVDLQTHVAAWYLWLISLIMKRNSGRLKAMPNPNFDIPDIYDSAYLTGLANLYTAGLPDAYTVLEKFGLDPNKIRERKLMQKKEESLWEAPATFKQQVVNGKSGTSDVNTKTVANSDRGGTNNRPPVGNAKKELNNG